jgi:hypothetical protein
MRKSEVRTDPMAGDLGILQSSAVARDRAPALPPAFKNFEKLRETIQGIRIANAGKSNRCRDEALDLQSVFEPDALDLAPDRSVPAIGSNGQKHFQPISLSRPPVAPLKTRDQDLG